MVNLDAVLKVVATLLTLAFAAVLLAGGPRRAANRLLAAFLLLVAANQGIEAFRAFSSLGPEATARAAALFASVDPAVLYAFVVAHHAPTLRARRALAPVAIAGAVLALLALVGPLGAPVDFARTLYTAMVYAATFALAAHDLVARPSPTARLLVAALAVAAVPIAMRVGGAGYHALVGIRIPARDAILVDIAVAAVAVLLFLAFASRIRAEAAESRVLSRSILLSAMLGLAFKSLDINVLMGNPVSGRLVLELLASLARSGAPIRWLIFGALASMAIVRYRLLDLSLPARRAAARGLVALALLLVAGLLLSIGDVTASVTPFEALLLLGVLVATQGFRKLVDRAALRLYGVPLPGNPQAATDAYRSAALAAAAEGTLDARREEMARLRAELGVDGATAAALEAAAEASVAGPLVPGQLVARRYRLTRTVGRGASGRAFAATDTVLARDVLVKEVLHVDDETAAQALREARTAGAFQHPHVVSVLDVVVRPGVSLLVTEFLPGGSLEDALRQEGRKRAPEAIRLVREILLALEAVHARGIVHGDVKPANVLLTAEGVAKLGDFGLARAGEPATVAVGTGAIVAGTPGYMAPEQLAGRPPVPGSDLYATGVLLRRLGPEPLPDGIARIVARATTEDPAHRYASAREMRLALESASRAEEQQ